MLQELYDSEINFEISCFWDGGFAVKLGDEINGFVDESNSASFVGAIDWLKNKAIEHYPKSAFATSALSRLD